MKSRWKIDVIGSNLVSMCFVAISALLLLRSAGLNSDDAELFQLFFTGDVYGYLKPCG